jgi:hypothetical protein
MHGGTPLIKCSWVSHQARTIIIFLTAGSSFAKVLQAGNSLATWFASKAITLHQ